MKLSSRKICSIAMTFVIAWCFTSLSHANPPAEPDESLLMNEDVNVVAGFYFREYSLRDNGVVDYKTARQIIVLGHSEYGNTVVHTEEHPLFYWYDSNNDGHMEMWVDQKVEGCACDVIPYQATYQE